MYNNNNNNNNNTNVWKRIVIVRLYRAGIHGRRGAGRGGLETVGTSNTAVGVTSRSPFGRTGRGPRGNPIVTFPLSTRWRTVTAHLRPDDRGTRAAGSSARPACACASRAVSPSARRRSVRPKITVLGLG